MKKFAGVLVLSLFSVFMFTSFVSAAEGPVGGFAEGVGNVIEAIYEILEPILSPIVGEVGGSELFLAKVLFLVIIFSVIWVSVKPITLLSSNSWIHWIVSIAVSILAIRWFGDAEIIKTAILPYSVLGITISVGLPFVLAFFIIEKGNFGAIARKFLWGLFAAVFIFLWITRYPEIKEFGYIYLVAGILAVIMALMDGSIQKFMNKMDLERVHAVHDRKLMGNLREELKKIDQSYRDDGKKYSGIYTRKKGRDAWVIDRQEIIDRINDLGISS